MTRGLTIDRRAFVAAIAGAGLAVAQVSSARRRISVRDFGADPTGKTDSALALQRAAQAVRVQRAAVLSFPHGTYRIASAASVAVELSGISNLEIEGNSSTLLLGQDTLCFNFSDSSNIVMHDLVIDCDPLPYTQGTVVDSGPNWFTLKVDPGFPVTAQGKVLAIGSYDRKTRALTQQPIDVYGAVAGMTVVGPADIRVDLKHAIYAAAGGSVPVGNVMVLRFQGDHFNIALTRCRGIAVRKVRLSSSHSGGVVATRSSDLSFEDFTIGFPPDGNRLLTTNKDGMDFRNCSGALTFRGCVFEGMGDDSINVIDEMWRLTTAADGSVGALTQSGKPAMSSDLSSAGTLLDVFDANDLLPAGNVKAVSSPGRPVRIGQAGDYNLSARKPDIVADPGLIPATEITDCRFNGNRARAIVAHRNIKIRNCSFQNLSLSAILLAPDSTYMEGPSTRDVVIDSNRFSGCHYTSKDPEGCITIDVMHSHSRRGPVRNGEAKNVLIVGNTFDSCPVAAIACRSVDQLVIENNRFGPVWTLTPGQPSPRAIIASQLTNSRISNNSSSTLSHIALDQSPGTIVSGNKGFAGPS